MEENTQKNYTKIILIVAIALLLIVACLLLVFKDKIFNKKPNKGGTETIITYPLKSELKMADNSINDFDLYFLQLENKPQNKIYSPISIKYALAMLNEGASGETKKQIDTIIGDYTARSYTNSANMSFANALFVKDSFQSKIKESYITTLQNQYDAEVKYDSFSSPDNINNWVSEKTFNLIQKPLEDVTGLKYAIINALAIDMEWQNEIQNEWQDYSLDYKHERAVEGDKTINHVNICSLNECGYSSLPLNNKEAKAVHFAAYANKYDIMNELGEDQIRETLNTEYEKWYEENKDRGFNLKEFNIDEYISELSNNYNKYSSSTDFLFYDDSNIKAFAKDLKTYDGVTLEYVGIMPKQTELTEYVKNINANKVKEVINNLKPIDPETFEEGYLTIIEGYLPLFDYDYDLNFKEDLQKIGIVDVFDMGKADLSNLSTADTYIDKALHKAKIEFSNKGIKAAAVTIFGGVESAMVLEDLEFTYAFDVPAKYIDLTFNKPYMYIIRDKESGEVWFTGTVYEGSAFSWNS
jgi:serine protease inhibitor